MQWMQLLMTIRLWCRHLFELEMTSTRGTAWQAGSLQGGGARGRSPWPGPQAAALWGKTVRDIAIQFPHLLFHYSVREAASDSLFFSARCPAPRAPGFWICWSRRTHRRIYWDLEEGVIFDILDSLDRLLWSYPESFMKFWLNLAELWGCVTSQKWHHPQLEFTLKKIIVWAKKIK